MPSILHALSDPARLEIVRRLAAGSEEWSCGRFELGLSKATLSHHFRVLREAGVVRTRPDGRKRLLSLRNEDLNSRFPGLLEAVLAHDHAQPLPPVLAAAGAAAQATALGADAVPPGVLAPRRPDGDRALHLRRAARWRRGVRGHPGTADAQPAGGGRAGRPRRSRRVRRRGAPPPRLRGLVTGRRAGRDRGPHREDPTDERRDRAQLGRSGQGVPGLRHARPSVRRAGGDHGGPRLLHRVLPAVRIRPRRLRRAVLREAAAAPGAAGARSASRWSGRHRAPLEDAGVYPRPVQDPLPIWVAVGGSPHSIIRAGRLGLPLALAIIGGAPERFAPLVQLYREMAREAGHDPAALPVGINSHTYVADSARAGYARVLPGLRRDDEPDRPRAWLVAHDPRAVRVPHARPAAPWWWAARRRWSRRSSSSTSCSATSASSPRSAWAHLPHAQVLRAIELLGTEVAPAVRAEVAAPRAR